MKYILICTCASQDKRAKASFELLFPGEPVPEIIKGKDKIYKLAKELGNEHIKAISKLSGKFAYYVELENNKIVKEYDLNKGSRIS